MSYKTFFLTIAVIMGCYIGMAQASNTCFFNGLSMSSGQIATGYKYTNVSYASGSLCTDVLTGYEAFQCLSNGTLDGLNGNNLGSQHYSAYPYLSCTVQAPANCVIGTPFGQQKVIQHTTSGFFSVFIPTFVGHALWYLEYFTVTGHNIDSYLTTAYENNIVDDSADCDIPAIQHTGSLYTGSFINITGANTTMAYCVDGQVYDLNTSLENLTGTLLDTNQYKYSTCSKRLPRSCSIGNIIIPDDDSITTYNTYDTPDGTLCQSQVRTCDDGTLSGSFIHTSCNTYMGACGTAHHDYFEDRPSYNLCAGGTPSIITWSYLDQKRSWQCEGYGSGVNSTVSCEAYQTGSNTRGVCNEFPHGATSLDSDNQGICRVGEATNFVTTSYGWTRNCRTSMGSSNQCSSSRGGGPTATITYSTTSLTNGPVTAYLSNIVPSISDGTVIYNNNGNNSRSFTSNGSFVFALKFGDRISYLTANVNWINQGPRTLADLVRSYTDTIVPAYRSLIRPQSSRYNLIDIQTMTNLGILIPTGTRSPTLDMRKKLTRAEFIQSIYTFMHTIHGYNDLPTSRSDGYSYKGARFSSTQRYRLGWSTKLDLRDHIKHTKTKKTLTIDRKKNITPKEVHDTITALLLMHDDNTALWEKVWSETIDKKQSSLTRAQYASMLRRVLESYDGIPIGNNPVIINKIYDRVRNKTISEQQQEIATAMTTLRQSDPLTMAKLGLSLGHLLIDLDAVVNNTIPKKKGRTILSIEQVAQKNRAMDNASTIFNTPLDRRQDFIMSQY